MKNKNTSLRNEQELSLFIPGPEGISWNETIGNFYYFAKISYRDAVTLCEQYLVHNDMRDPDAAIEEVLTERMDPVVGMLLFFEKHGMPANVSQDIRDCDLLHRTKDDVIKELTPEARKMRLRKISSRKRRDDYKKNGYSIIVD
jgi:hypothetical protein